MFNKNEKRQSQFEAICEQIDLTIARHEAVEYSKPIWQVLLEELDSRTQIFKRDKDGNIERTTKGFPKVDWLKIVANLPVIIAYLSKLLGLIKAR